MMNNNDKGFTLIELVVVILVTSILAISAIPNISTSTTYSAYTDRDQLISLLRSVQTRAMQNTQDGYCYGVKIDPTGSRIAMLAQESDGDCSDDNFLTSSEAIDGYLNLVPENFFTTTHLEVRFNDLGQPENDTQVRVTFDNTEVVCIEPQGYIHVCT